MAPLRTTRRTLETAAAAAPTRSSEEAKAKATEVALNGGEFLSLLAVLLFPIVAVVWAVIYQRD